MHAISDLLDQKKTIEKGLYKQYHDYFIARQAGKRVTRSATKLGKRVLRSSVKK